MAAKQRLPVTRSVKLPEALTELRAWLDTFDPVTRERGESYFTGLHVEKVWADADHFVQASVRGQELYAVRLFLTRGKWSSRCTCPVGVSCKHAYAAGRAWVQQCEQDPVAPGLTDDAPPPVAFSLGDEPFVAEFTAATGQPPDSRQLAFLRNLAAVLRSLRQSSHGWFDHAALAALVPLPDRPLLRQDSVSPFQGWWRTPPATPLQLWPFVALLFTELGIPLPAFTAPFDRLAAARETREAARRDALLQAWSQRFAELDQLVAPAPTPALLQAVRLRLGPKKCLW